MVKRGTAALAGTLLSGALALFGAACRNDMGDQPRYKPLASSSFFADGRASRPLVEDTVPRDSPGEGLAASAADAFPFAVTRAVLDRGEQRFGIFCSPCHGATGDGDGMIVQRGFPPPPSFHIDRLRHAPPGHFVDVIENGFGAMMDYRSRVAAEDRWAIAAYIRVLQLSENARIEDVPPQARVELSGETR